jgi:hypothetical protein
MAKPKYKFCSSERVVKENLRIDLSTLMLLDRYTTMWRSENRKRFIENLLYTHGNREVKLAI